MIFQHPIYLLLAAPLLLSLVHWGFRTRWLLGLRAVTLTLIVLALAGLTIRFPSRAGTIVVVADRSLSMPLDAENQQKEAINLLHDALGPDDRLAVVSFGRQTGIEMAPQSGKFTGFQHEVGRDASNLAEAMEAALGLIPAEAPGRLLVLSDGQWTGHDPAVVAARAAGRGVAVDYRALQRPPTNDVAIARVDAPTSVAAGESFLITAWIVASVRQEIAYELRRGAVRLAGDVQKVEPGLNRLIFRDQAIEPGTQAYTFTIAAKENDAVPENNQARLLVGVQGPRPVLVVTSTPLSGFPSLLQQGGLKVKAAPPDQCAWTLAELSKYSAVVLENVPAHAVGLHGMETLATWVQQIGAGLMMTGGRSAYGPGGYFKSPLEAIMPVTMELRPEHRKLSMAMVVVLDRSFSWSVPFGKQNDKMELATLGAAQVLDLMTPHDELGVIGATSTAQVIRELGVVANRAEVRERILRVGTQPGGFDVHVALEAATTMLRDTKAGTRHIVLLVGAADAIETGSYKKLIAKCQAENITISVIGLGQENDKMGGLLKDIAKRANGRVFFAESAEELPRLFAQDAFITARSTFLDEPTPVQTMPALSVLAGRDFKLPKLGGYNLCYLRPSAELATVTLDEYSAPVVAARQVGAGRVLCYTGEVNGKFTGAMAGWPEVGNFYASLARWTAGRVKSLPPKNMVLTQDVKNGLALVQLHLDPHRQTEPFAVLPEAVTLRASSEKKPRVDKARMQWTAADTLAVQVPLFGSDTALTTVNVPGHGPVTLAPVCLPYSPEFAPDSNAWTLPGSTAASPALPRETSEFGWGQSALERLARVTGGKERIDLAGAWKDIPRHRRQIPLAAWLLSAAAFVLLLEVLERLTGLLSRSVPVLRRSATATVAQPARAVAAAAVASVKKPVAVPAAAAPSPPAAEMSGILEALRQVQKRRDSRK